MTEMPFLVFACGTPAALVTSGLKAKPERSRPLGADSRPDALHLVLVMVVTEEGLPLSYEVFEGKSGGRHHARGNPGLGGT